MLGVSLECSVADDAVGDYFGGLFLLMVVRPPFALVVGTFHFSFSLSKWIALS